MISQATLANDAKIIFFIAKPRVVTNDDYEPHFSPAEQGHRFPSLRFSTEKLTDLSPGPTSAVWVFSVPLYRALMEYVPCGSFAKNQGPLLFASSTFSP